MKAIVLSAGHGTRLGSLTARVPKVLLPLAGRPLLEYTLEHLASEGFRDVGINLHHGADAVREHFGDGARFGVRIEYSHEERLLGTAGALKGFESWLGEDESFLVLYGDILTDQSFAPLLEAHRRHGALATLLLHRRAGSNSVVGLDEEGRITAFLERPDARQRQAHPGAWVNSGVQVLHRRVLDRLTEGEEADLPKDVYVPSVGEERLAGVPLTGFRCAIDSVDRLEEAEAAVREGRLSSGRGGQRSGP